MPLPLPLLFLAAGTPALAPADAPPPIRLKHCRIEYERGIDLGAGQSGILRELVARPGSRVKAGELLGRLDADDARAELELRTADVVEDVEVRLAESKLKLAKNRLRASESLNRRNLVSAEDYQAQSFEVDAATLAVEDARRQKRVAEILKKRAEAALRAREFASPIDGVVVAAPKSVGEGVQPGEVVFRVVDPDRLRVVGYLDVADAWRVLPGDPVRVLPDVPGVDLSVESEVFEGRVDFVDPQVNPDDQTCKVVAIVANRDGRLRAGLESRMEIVAGGESR